MISILISVFVFWIWPALDIRKIRKVRGIGRSKGGAPLDQSIVEGWKAGRLRAKVLWVGFGTVITSGVLLDQLIPVLWMPDGMMPDAQIATAMGFVELAALFGGGIGFIAGLIYSAYNNKKYLGQLRVML